MSKYPLEAGEPEAFTPLSLKGLPDAPIIWLRWGTPREKEQQRRLMDEEGATIHSQGAMRAEILNGMKELLGPDDFAIWEPRAKEWWDAVDLHEKENADVPLEDQEKFAFEGQDLIVEVLEQVGRDWRPFKRMNADNLQYNRLLGHAINAVCIVDVENLKTPLKRVGRYIDFDSARQVSDDLLTWAQMNKVDISDMRPDQELGMECMRRLFLGKERAGNFVSPVPSGPTPDTSTTGTGETNGKSKASARSRKTRAAG